jgi:tripartite-type tricarboxylate transporter receptor subunit TctC
VLQGRPVIENKGGAGGNIGSQAVAQSAPDGYTILLYGPGLAINPWLYPTGYNAANDLAPITLVTVIPNLMMVPNSSHATRARIVAGTSRR